MDRSVRKGFSYGLTSAIITTLGLMVGLDSSTHSKLAVIGGVLTIAIADALSDAIGMHISEEAENIASQKGIWETTISTFVAKFAFATTFVIPLILLPIQLAIITSLFYGMFLLGMLSYDIARKEGKNIFRVIGKHITMALIVIFITYYVGSWIRIVFN